MYVSDKILFRYLKIDASVNILRLIRTLWFLLFIFLIDYRVRGKNLMSLSHLLVCLLVVSCMCPDQESSTHLGTSG